jgi:hypothetical protein
MTLRRPTCFPASPRVARPAHLQLGADPPRAISIDLPDPASRRMLDLLDGADRSGGPGPRRRGSACHADDARAARRAARRGLVLPRPSCAARLPERPGTG